MTFSLDSARRMATGLLAGATASVWFACGGEETKSTGLEMGRAPTQATAAAPASTRGANSAPEISELVLRPDSPRPGERLTAVVEAFDPDGDPVQLDFDWTVDGAAVDNRGNEFMLRDVEKGAWV